MTTEAALTGPAEHLERLFAVALAPADFVLEWQTARNALADLVHGFALAGTEVPLSFLSDELRILISGMSRGSGGPVPDEPGDDVS